MGEHPEHEKLKAIKPLSQACGDFLEWLQEQNHSICFHGRDEWGDLRYVPASSFSKEKMLANYFEIDLVKLEAEKRAMMEELKAATNQRSEDDG